MSYLSRYTESGLSLVKYLVAVLTIGAGLATAVADVETIEGPLGLLYGTRTGLVLFGLVAVVCGFMLLYGKVKRSRQWTGMGLMACYCCFLFATLVQITAFGISPETWVGNAFFALITGALWLRWKFKTSYINPGHFRSDITELNTHKRD